MLPKAFLQYIKNDQNIRPFRISQGDDFFVEILKDSLEAKYREVFPNTQKALQESDFIKLEKLISVKLSEEGILSEKQKIALGVSVDIATLKRIFRYKYSIKDGMDLRKRKILDKVSIFIGFKDWDAFVNEKRDTHIVSITEDNMNLNVQDAKEIRRIINEAIKAEFYMLKEFSEIRSLDVANLYIAGDPRPTIGRGFYEKLINNHNAVISNVDNPSSCEIASIEIMTLGKSSNLAVAGVTYIWDLWWFTLSSLSYKSVLSTYSETFLVHKINGRWLLDSTGFYKLKKLLQI